MSRPLHFILIIILTLFSGEFIMATAKTKEKTANQLTLDARLIDAVKEQNPALAEKILSMGADPNAEDEDSVSALYFSVFKKNAELVKILIKHGVDLKKGSDVSESLCHAAYNFDLKIIKLLVQGGIDINCSGHNSYTALYSACSYMGYRNNPVDAYLAVQYLISKGADVNAKYKNDPERKEDLLCEAVTCDDPKLVKLLLDAGAGINTKNVYGATPLMVAAGMNNKNTKKIFMMLLKHGADVNGKKGDGETALYKALYHSEPDTEIVTALIKKGSRIHEDEMCCAAANGDPKIFNLLHRTKPKIDYTELLYNAGKGGSVEIISIIKTKESDNPKLKETLLAAFYQAAKNGRLRAVEYFLNNGADVNYRRNNDEDPVLLTASGNGHIEVVKLLLSREADVNGVDDHGKSSLIAASISGHAPVVELLLKNGADINHFEGHHWHRNPLLCACYYNKLDVVSILIEKGADLNVKNEDGKSPLGIAITHHNYNLIALLLENGIDPDENIRDSETILVSAAESGNLSLIKILMGKEKKFRNRGRTGPALIAAAQKGNIEVVEFLLKNGADASQYGSRALLAACRLDGEKGPPVVKILLEHKAPNNYCNSEGETPLIAALSNRYDDNGDIARVLLTQKINVNTNNDKGMTPLMYAAERGEMDLVEVLLEKNAKVNFQYRKTDWGKFFELLRHNLWIDITTGFKNHSSFIPVMKEVYYNCLFIGETSLLIAACEKSYRNRANRDTGNEIVKLLLEKGADVNARSSHGNTPLINASRGSSLETVNDIIDAGADISAVNKNGINALMTAAESGHVSVVKLLLEKGADPDETAGNEMNRETALMFAAYENHTEVVKILLENGADIHIKDMHGSTVMNWAKSSDVRALLRKKEKNKDVSKLSAAEKKLNLLVAKEREKKEEADLALEEKNRKTYPKDTEIYQFFDPFEEPLAGAEFRVEYDGKKSVKTTDKEGQIYLHKVKDKNSIIIQNENLNILISGKDKD